MSNAIHTTWGWFPCKMTLNSCLFALALALYTSNIEVSNISSVMYVQSFISYAIFVCLSYLVLISMWFYRCFLKLDFISGKTIINGLSSWYKSVNWFMVTQILVSLWLFWTIGLNLMVVAQVMNYLVSSSILTGEINSSLIDFSSYIFSH